MTRHTPSWVRAALSRPPQEGDTLCPLLLKTQTKAQPGPRPPREHSQGLRGARARMCLR